MLSHAGGSRRYGINPLNARTTGTIATRHRSADVMFVVAMALMRQTVLPRLTKVGSISGAMAAAAHVLVAVLTRITHRRGF